MTIKPILPAIATFPAGVLREVVAVAVFAGSARPEHRRTGLPTSPAVGLRIINKHWQIWAGCGGVLAIANRSTDQADTAVLNLDGGDLRALEPPKVLRCFRAAITGNRVDLVARGWRGSVRVRRRGPCDPAGAILGVLIAEPRPCRAPRNPEARRFTGSASWFRSIFDPEAPPPQRCAAWSKSRIAIVYDPTVKA